MNTKEIKFNSINEIINDPYFIKIVNENVANLVHDRVNRPQPKKGYYYKRDWYDRMAEQSIVNSRFFLANIPGIWVKKSNLSSEIRNVIKYVCDNALNKTLLYYSKNEVK